MILRLVLLILSVFATSFVALLVALSSTVKTASKIAFSMLCFGLCAWQINIFVADHLNADLLFMNTVLFIWPSIAILGMGYFILLLQRTEKSFKQFIAKHKLFTAVQLILFGLQILAISSGKIFSAVFYNDSGELTFYRGTAYFLYIACVLLAMILQMGLLAKLNNSTKKGSYEKYAIRTVFITLMITIFYSVTTNVVIPIITSSQQYISLGVFGIVIFSGGLALSITKYKFLNVRMVVARTVSYFLSLGALLGFYVTLAVVITNALPDKEGLRVLLTAIIVAVATVSYTPLKKKFDKLSNNLFYRDAYDPQQYLNDLNQTLASTLDLQVLLNSSSSVIEKYLKTSFCFFAIKETEYVNRRIIGTNKHFKIDDIKMVRNLTPHITQKVIDVDELSYDDTSLAKILRKYEVAILVRLTNSPGAEKEGIGYMVLGPKMSGNPYSKQDKQVIEITANSMIIAIDNALRFEEIQEFNVTLEQKVEDATHRLRRANDKLVALDQTKDDFISMASHQLRTPLTSVKGYLSMVLEGDAGKVSKQQEKLLDQAFVSSQRMVYLIADLLNVSRLRTGKFVIEPNEVNLADVVEGEVQQLQETAEARELTLEYKKPKDFPNLWLDETKIRQVIMNFVDNAIYYTPAGGKIEVSLRDTGQSIEFKVIDSGIGVPKHEQHNLFSKFFRAGNAKKARPDGTGLGLFMAKKVVVAQGGAVLFSSKEGKGSTFGFTFAKANLKPPKIEEPAATKK